MNVSTTTGTAVSQYEWSPNSAYIAYISDQSGGIPQLYVSTSPSTAASGVLVSGSAPTTSVTTFEWSPNSRYIAFNKDNATGQYELYTVAVGSTTPERVSPTITPAGGDVENDFAWSPDSSRIAFRVDNSTLNVIEVYSCDYDGDNLNPVSAMSVAPRYAKTFKWSPDSTMIAYVGDQRADSVNEIFVTVDGTSNRIKLNHTPCVNGNVSTSTAGFKWSPDSSMVAFTGDIDIDGTWELFVSYIDTYSSSPDEIYGTMFRMTEDMPVGGSLTSSYGDPFIWAPDSSRIVYSGYIENTSDQEIEIVDIDGTNRTRLNNTLPDGADVYSYAWLPNGSRIIYHSDQDIDNVYELYSITPDGSTRVKLNGDMIADADFNPLGDVNSSQWGILPNSSRVVYLANQDDETVIEIYSVTPAGAGLIKLNDTIVGSGNVQQLVMPE